MIDFLQIALLLLLSIAFVGVWRRLAKLEASLTQVERDQVRIIRQVSTRQSVAGMQSGAETPEQGLTRLGRKSAAQRVVFGGEPESKLHQDLEGPNG